MKYKQLTIKLKPTQIYAREPYKQFKKHPAWPAINEIIEDLTENLDLVETNERNFITGYILKRLIENDLLK